MTAPATPTGNPRVLTTRELNRTLLDRQWLLRPRRATVIEALTHLVGLQAQQTDPPYYALWTRLADFAVGDLSATLEDRRTVRVALQRGTIHLVTASDCLALRPLIQPMLDATLWDSQYSARVRGVDPRAVARAGLKALADGPLTNTELAARLAEDLPGYDGGGLAYLLRCLHPLIQVPPRGVWGRSGGLRYADAHRWLEPTAETSTLDELITRYLSAYGPASIADMRKWTGLTGLGDTMERLRPRLVTYADERGRELFDLPDIALPDPDTPVPVTLVAPFDGLLLAHADRSRIIDRAYISKVFSVNGLLAGTYLVDGRVAGKWKPTITRRRAEIVFTPFSPPTDDVRGQLDARGRELLTFAADETAEHQVTYAPPA